MDFLLIQYLHSALIRYKQWLSIKQRYPSEFYSPTYDIDVVWHAHQWRDIASESHSCRKIDIISEKKCNTEEYQGDTKALLGKILNHDDSVNERYVGSKLDQAQV